MIDALMYGMTPSAKIVMRDRPPPENMSYMPNIVFWSGRATSLSVSRLTTSYSTRNGLWNPRLGTRRCSGIWPPSNPRLNLKPERDFAPLCPRPAVLPLPEPWPRPIRFFGCFIPFGGRRLLSDILDLLAGPHPRTCTPARLPRWGPHI